MLHCKWISRAIGLTLRAAQAGLAADSFAVTGGIGVQRVGRSDLHFRLTTQNALILQNDDLSVRANSDIRVEGPLNAASVTGNVFVTRSAFFRNIDILPIGLPGRPAPQPPAEPVFVSFPNPPCATGNLTSQFGRRMPFSSRATLPMVESPWT